VRKIRILDSQILASSNVVGSLIVFVVNPHDLFAVLFDLFFCDFVVIR
jgi:hypothetical protein